MAVASPEPKSRRARRMYEGDVPSTIDQIPTFPGTEAGSDATGAWAYYLREDGETIGEILIIQPNGGIPDIPDARMRGKFGTNASYFRDRYAAKGIKFLGSKLDEKAMTEVARVLAANRDEGIAYCEDMIAEADDVIANSDRPDVRDQFRRRKQQFEKRKNMLEAPFDQDAVLVELKRAARAYTLSKIDPNILPAIQAIVGEAMDERLAADIAHFQGRQAESPLVKAKPSSRGGGSDRGAGFQGEAFVDADPT